ncbi:hypothetical protein BDY19DRAFT_438762 [Irpex rosettiformis]|uniref:Uncharacterized protein n=1 Tax=Irpex rosettiformis TaxID=378272 RepID=A0ACB8TU07_9APHY|nr:hypothetical protein BDY19DRAFT_438762 [Irpex rosettiformis]
MMPMYLSPVSALHTGFPIVPQSGRTCPTPFDCYYPGSGVEYPHPRMNSYHRRPVYPSTHYHHIPVDVDAAVERAAYEYAISQRRSRAIEQERLRRILAIQEHRRQVEEQRRAKEARAQAQAQAHAQAQVVAMGIAVEQEARRQARSAQYTREYERAKAEEVARLQHALRRQQEAEIRKCEAAQKAFLDAVRARSNEPEQLPHIHVRVCYSPCARRSLAHSPDGVHCQPQAASGQRVETPQETLRRRLEVDEDVEVQGIIANLLKLVAASSATSDNHEDKTKDTPAAQDKGKARESPDISFPWERASERQAELDKVGETIRVVHFDKPVVSPAAPSTRTTPVPTQSEAEGADLHRKPAIRRSTDTQLSLGAIDRVGNLLQELKGSFVFPTDLDHPSSPSRSPSPSPVSDSDSAQLPFTSKNKPVHLYEHALNGLLARLDEVDSYGDEEVRRRRKEVVLEIEKALEDVARKVAEASPVLEEAILPEETEIPSVPVAAPVSEEEVATPEEAAVEPEILPTSKCPPLPKISRF